MTLLLVNFGGPRNLGEIRPFLEELLCDSDVVRTKYPPFFQRWLFGKIARKRAVKIAPDYELIGGKSPIYFDTEAIGKRLSEKTGKKIICFHRYLPSTHDVTLKAIESLDEEMVTVLPLFPQFTFATTGSIARFFQERLKRKAAERLQWISSYCAHGAFVKAWQTKIETFLQIHQIENPVLLFSAHGIPLSFVKKGDPYQEQCERTFREVMKAFPNCLGRLCYQSKFGPGEWLRPYTNEACEEILQWHQGRKNIVFVPISFTSDHIETLYEIQYLYLPLIQERGLGAYRCPALNLDENWIDALVEISQQKMLLRNFQLVRRRIFTNHVVSLLP